MLVGTLSTNFPSVLFSSKCVNLSYLLRSLFLRLSIFGFFSSNDLWLVLDLRVNTSFFLDFSFFSFPTSRRPQMCGWCQASEKSDWTILERRRKNRDRTSLWKKETMFRGFNKKKLTKIEPFWKERKKRLNSI